MLTILYKNAYGLTWQGRCKAQEIVRVVRGTSQWLCIEPARDMNDDNSFNYPSGDMHETITIQASSIIQINAVIFSVV